MQRHNTNSMHPRSVPQDAYRRSKNTDSRLAETRHAWNQMHCKNLPGRHPSTPAIRACSYPRSPAARMPRARQATPRQGRRSYSSWRHIRSIGLIWQVPAQEQAEVVAGGGENSVDAVAVSALEIVAAHPMAVLEMEVTVTVHLMF